MIEGTHVYRLPPSEPAPEIAQHEALAGLARRGRRERLALEARAQQRAEREQARAALRLQRKAKGRAASHRSRAYASSTWVAHLLQPAVLFMLVMPPAGFSIYLGLSLGLSSSRGNGTVIAALLCMVPLWIVPIGFFWRGRALRRELAWAASRAFPFDGHLAALGRRPGTRKLSVEFVRRAPSATDLRDLLIGVELPQVQVRKVERDTALLAIPQSSAQLDNRRYRRTVHRLIALLERVHAVQAIRAVRVV